MPPRDPDRDNTTQPPCRDCNGTGHEPIQPPQPAQDEVLF